MIMDETFNLPPGFRFHPTDEELISYYLTNKVSDFAFTTRAVADVDLNKCEPWDLPAKASMGEKEWYFFSLKDRKYPTGLRTNRATEAGYWKTTGKDKEIFRGGVLVGMKKTLVFYKGRAPKGEKTNWVMHEYRLENKLSFKSIKEEWVVCRIFQKSAIVKKPQQTSISSPPISQDDSPSALGDIELPNFISNNANNMGDIFSSSNNPMMNATTLSHHPLQSLSSSNWPFLSTNLSMNSLLLTALQLRGHDPRVANANSDIHNYSFMPQTNVVNSHNFVNDHDFNMGSTSRSVLDSVPPELSYNNIDDPSNIW